MSSVVHIASLQNVGGERAVPKNLRWAVGLSTTLESDSSNNPKEDDDNHFPDAIRAVENNIVLQAHPRFDKKWINCDLRTLSDEVLLNTLYNTLVYDGELVRIQPSKTYTSKSTGKTYKRGKLVQVIHENNFIF